MSRPEVAVAIVGAGLAGTCVAQALVEHGVSTPLWLDAPPPTTGPARGSDSAVALVHPLAGRTFVADADTIAAWTVARRWLSTLEAATVHRARLRRRVGDDEPGRRLAASLPRATETFAAAQLDVLSTQDPDGVRVIEYGPVFGVDLPRAIASLHGELAGRGVRPGLADVVRLEPIDGGIRLCRDDGTSHTASHVVLAAGASLARLLAAHVDAGSLERFEGVAALVDAPARPHFVVDRGHVASSRTTVGWGATFRSLDRPDARAHAEQLAAIEHRLAAFVPRVAGARVWMGVRVVDRRTRRPWVGRVAPRLWVLGALGSQGVLRAPIAAQAIAQALAREIGARPGLS